jgi:hypothetical protein
MFIKLPRKQNILFVDHDFSELIDIKPTDGENILVYDVSYYIDQIRAIEFNGARVRISIASGLDENITGVKSDNSLTNTNLIERIQTSRARRKELRKVNRNKEITAKEDNPGLNIDSETSFQVKSFMNSSVRQTMSFKNVRANSTPAIFKKKTVLRQVGTINKLGIKAPVLQQSKMSTKKQLSLPSVPAPGMLLNLVLNSGKDPASIADVAQNTSNFQQSLQGTLSLAHKNNNANKNIKLLNDIVTQKPLKAENTDELEADKMLAVLEYVKDNFKKSNKILKVPESKVINGIIFVRIELLDARNAVLDSYMRKIFTEDDIRLFNIIKYAPEIRLPNNIAPGKIQLLLKQNDRRATRILLYKKVIAAHDPQIKTQKYRLIDELGITSQDDFKPIEIDVDSRNATIYRAIAVGPDDNVSLRFSSTVVRADRKNDKPTGSSLEARITLTGVALEVNIFPANAIAVRIVRRDATLHEKFFTQINVPDPVRLLNERFFKTFIDQDVKPWHAYEYRAEFYYRDGTTDHSQAHAIVEYIPLKQNENFTTLSVPVHGLVDNQFNCTFSINTSLPKKGLDLIASLLSKNNLSEFFKDDEKLERDKFSDLLAYRVMRTNLTTGEKESFGDIDVTAFDDITLGANAGVSPLLEDNSYRYECRTLLRAPETLFADFKKTSKDRTGRKYHWSPHKFRHPIVARTGNLPTAESLITNHSSDEMDFGDIGSSASVTFSLNRRLPSISTARVKRIRANLAVISWEVTGDYDMIDHFIILRNTLTDRSILSKAHAHVSVRTFEIFHKLDDDDIGEMSYIIMPVYNDYSYGKSIETGSITHTSN